MDEPARKRRRTNSPLERASSPLRNPPRRPSFASPTKASLARNYPSLLPTRPTSVGSPSRPSSRGDILARGKQARAFVLGETDVQEELGRERAQLRSPHETSETLPVATPRANKTGGRYNNSPTSPRAVEEEEPELPATPSQRGFEEQDGPRRGVLFSSPSKRPPRMKGAVKQSPLRPKANPVQETSSVQHIEDGPVDSDAKDQAGKKEPLDPEIEKRKQEKARLKRDLADLEAQVSRCSEEIVKEQQRSPVEALRAAERMELQNFITKVSSANAEVEIETPVSSLLCSFLPFSTLSIPRPQNKALGKPVPSHRPVELADPLPYLQMFTSLSFTTQLSLPRGKVNSYSRRVHQKHTIDIAGPQKLLTAQISVVIDTLANEIVDMQILRLSPWAKRELGSFLHKCAAEKDLGNACWAIESYWIIAQKRAQHWHQCESKFSYLLAGQTSENTENVRRQNQFETKKISRRDLNRHSGRDSLVLQDKHVLLKLNWRIGFDWTGEAESEVTVEPAFPSVWTEADGAKTFSKVPETFASLLQSRGVFEATRVMTVLLFAK
jgi:hypothetical protein